LTHRPDKGNPGILDPSKRTACVQQFYYFIVRTNFFIPTLYTRVLYTHSVAVTFSVNNCCYIIIIIVIVSTLLEHAKTVVLRRSSDGGQLHTVKGGEKVEGRYILKPVCDPIYLSTRDCFISIVRYSGVGGALLQGSIFVSWCVRRTLLGGLANFGFHARARRGVCYRRVEDINPYYTYIIYT